MPASSVLERKRILLSIYRLVTISYDGTEAVAFALAAISSSAAAAFAVAAAAAAAAVPAAAAAVPAAAVPLLLTLLRNC